MMAASTPLSASSIGRKRSVSSTSKSRGMATNMQDFTMSPGALMRYFEPCAATAGMFLYAQGNSIVCCHHDTLTIERRFSRHSDEIQLLAVDTQSERGAGRLVVSYDAGQTAIVWDIMTGEEVARFASYEHLTTAAWMRNGNVAFGNTQGNIILFEPETSEHLSSRTLDQIAVTSLAPASDCRTFAIGYQNGSLLVCNLQPRFMILHNLTTSRGPSPIVNLAWHASSSRQKSDMLAAQTNDGDLRVWSVSKSYNSSDPAKVVRILKRSENFIHGPNWMGWSKNGRIIQFTEGETLSWDVRTKHVTNDLIPTLEHVRGLAVYGPGASLFTLGANNTVQQFDLNAPAMMVVNVQHPANLLPPSPPVSIEEQEKSAASSAVESEIAIHIEGGVSESDEDTMSPLARMMHAQSMEDDSDIIRTASPASSHSQLSSVGSASSRTPGRYNGSVQSRGMTEATYISAGSSLRPSMTYGQNARDNDRDSYSISSLSSVSMTSSHNRSSRRRPSRLRNEVPRSPEDSKVHDLFKFTKARLSDVPYKRPPMADASRLTNDDLRRQMLSTIFGWTKDIEDLVRDEMSRHPIGSTNRILLSKWLGDVDADIMASSSQNMTSSDWMLLALSGIGGPQSSQQKLGRAYVQRLLESGDVHAATTIMIGMGDRTDAIEIYVSHKRYMEALLLACLSFPSVWERQVQIITKWGDWAAQHSQRELAVRCYACTTRESTEPWTSPSAAQVTFQSINGTLPEVLSPPLSPPGFQRGPQRSIAKTSALKLITSFGDQHAKAKFYNGHGQDDGQTPIAGGATPIVDSGISPAGDVTAFLKPSNRSHFNTPNSARSTSTANAGFSRQRLPSIGEVNDHAPNRDLLRTAALPTPPMDQRGNYDNTGAAATILRAATASPMMMRDSHRRRERERDAAPPLSPSPASLAALMEAQQPKRNGSRTRIPNGVAMQLRPTDMGAAGPDQTSPEQSVTSSAASRYHWPKRRGPGSVASSITTQSSNVRRNRAQEAGKSLDDYIHSLDAAKARTRGRSKEKHKPARDSSKGARGGSRERSGERARASSHGYSSTKTGKRSPRSPVPMSPEELINLSTPKMGEGIVIDVADPDTVRKVSNNSRASSKGRGNSRNSSRRRSPDRRPPALDLPRGRSDAREGSVVRSPSSPLPMSANAHFYNASDEEDDYREAIAASQVKHRRSANRSSSRTRERSRSRARGAAAARGEVDAPETRTRTPAPLQQQPGVASAGDLRLMKDERTLKKEAAARELEERRRSLARRPLAPAIPHPDELSPSLRPSHLVEMASITEVTARDLPPRSATAEPLGSRDSGSAKSRSMYSPGRVPAMGLPATPKAMRLAMDGDPHRNPGVPPVPPMPMHSAKRSSPTGSAQSSPKHAGNNSPKREAPAAAAAAPAPAPAPLTLLPSTVYSPPSRPPIARCMSAPPEEPVAPASLRGDIVPLSGGGLKRGHSARKLSTPDVHEVRIMAGSMRRGSHDDQIPPPPPPPLAPMLKELAHLAIPPPPPPAPLQMGGSKPIVYGGQTSGTIEIVMDDGQTQAMPVSAALPAIEPLVSPPVASSSSSRAAHHRGRSSVDNSIGARFTRATERMRSASRGRASIASRTKSPEVKGPYEGIPQVAPYESIPPPMPMSFQARADLRTSHQQAPAQNNTFRTGLLENEMI